MMDIVSESEHYIIFQDSFETPSDALELAEEARREGFRPLCFGYNGGLFCEKALNKEESCN